MTAAGHFKYGTDKAPTPPEAGGRTGRQRSIESEHVLSMSSCWTLDQLRRAK
jgi:hypothetical protein